MSGQGLGNRSFRQMLICGLDYSGKTTLIKNYISDLDIYASKKENKPKGTPEEKKYDNTNRNQEMYYTTPYINIEKFNLPTHSMPCVVYDISGQGRYRDNWSFFYPDVDGILFVVDCADKDRLPIVVEVLEEMARHPGLANRNIPFLICANK